MRFCGLCWVPLGLLLVCAVRGQEIVGVRRIPDPPPPVDGSLSRIGDARAAKGWNEEAQVVVGAEHWQGVADLSGELMVGWDQHLLYIAARVRDDYVVQPFFGSHLWKGDHLEVFLDLPRQPSGSRDPGTVTQLGVSPGNFRPGETAVPAEVVRWKPSAGPVAGVRVASRRTKGGYQVETAIPWRSLGIEGPAEGLHFGLDVALSDSDTPGEGGQESVASLIAGPWRLRDPDRMLDAVLGDTSGQVDPAALASAFESVCEGVEVTRGQSVEIDLGAADKRRVRELIVRARLDFRKIAGGTGALRVTVNGAELLHDHVRNRLRTFRLGASVQNTHRGAGWFVLYAPDYEPPDAFSPYHVRGANPYELRFDVSSLWRAEGGNKVEIAHVQPKAPADMVVDVGVSNALSPKLTPPPLRPAPTGPIPTFVPRGPARPSYTWQLADGGAVEVSLGARTWLVESDFSTREPGWTSLGRTDGGWGAFRKTQVSVSAHADEFAVQRTVEQHDDHLHITDRIVNRTPADLPVMVRHHVEMGDGLESVIIAGKETATPRYRSDEGEHPASVGVYSDAGLGLIGEDDVMRATGHQYRDGSVLGVGNSRLAVATGTTLAIEFSIYPLELGDPFAFLNRVRRNWGVNFTIPGSSCFISPRTPIADYSDEQFGAYLDNKSAWATSTGGLKIRGRRAHGTGYFEADKTAHTALLERVARIRPQTQRLFYFHCFISVGQDDPERYADSILRRPDGSHGDYRNPLYPIYVPREGTAFAAVQQKLIEARWQDFPLTGIYWDEMAYSAHKYDCNDSYWDGVTADIDPDTHRITRKRSSVTLATLSWRKVTAERIMARGLLIGNGAPQTRTFARLRFPRFIETGSITKLTKGQLYTPVALGDHLTERTATDCYQNMLKALDFGAVYYWYYYRVEPHAQPTLTDFMFPITYIEMGPGFVIGRERILTNRSGLFGWGDDSPFEAVVFDREGKRTDTVRVPRLFEDGQAFAEVRIAEGYAVALIRR